MTVPPVEESNASDVSVAVAGAGVGVGRGVLVERRVCVGFGVQ